jgi:hypothetical protein
LEEDESVRERQRLDVNYYALDYMDDPESDEPKRSLSMDALIASIPEGLHDSDDEGDLRVAAPSSAQSWRGVGGTVGGRPALQTISYDPGTGQARPLGIKDVAPPGVQRDLRGLRGAPQEGDHISHTERPKEFFDATSFYPNVGTPLQRKLAQAREAVDPIVCGHDHELPGSVPWHVFMFGSVLLGSVWIAAAVYQYLDSCQVMHGFKSMRIDTVNTGNVYNFTNVTETKLPLSSLLQSWSTTEGQTAEKLDMSLPFAHILPQGLSCDAAGRFFAITDGLSTFVGEAGLKRNLRRQGAGNAGRSVPIEFRQVGRCASLLGEALQDTAIACAGGSRADSASCNVLLLHHQGRRVASCPVAHDAANTGRGDVAALSQRWLHKKQNSEKASWLLLDSACLRDAKMTSQLGCASVGTTHGRVAHLQHSESQEPSAPVGALFPDTVMPETSEGPKTGAWSPGMVRAFNSRYLGVLQRDRSSIQVLDASQDMSEAGTLTLPSKASVGGFCAGGGHVYFLSKGDTPELWRLPLPAKLDP